MIAMLLGVIFIMNGEDVEGLGDLVVAILEGMGLTGSSGLDVYVLVGVVLFFGGLTTSMYSSRVEQRSPHEDDGTA
jgi:hypothetical protein